MKYADVSGESFIISSESKVNSETDKYAKKYAKKVIAGCPSDGRSVSINLHLSIPEKIQTRLGSHFCNNEECYAVEIGENDINLYALITRQDMMLIVYRALAKLDVEIKESDVAKADTYEDLSEISDYAKEAVTALVNAGFVNGKSGKIAPKDYTTRAEVAVLIKRILDYTK